MLIGSGDPGESNVMPSVVARLADYSIATPLCGWQLAGTASVYTCAVLKLSCASTARNQTGVGDDVMGEKHSHCQGWLFLVGARKQ
jgi:hypothetical protein